MSLNVSDFKGKGKDFGPIEEDTYPARLVQVVGLGEHEQIDFKTKESKGDKPRVILTFEFPTELIEVKGEMKPRWFSREYTISDHELATMVKILKALDPSGKETDLVKLLGAPCSVTTGLTSGNKVKILSVNSVAKGMKVDALANPVRYFDPEEADFESFKSLPKWIQDKIKEGADYPGSNLESAVVMGEADLDEDIPF